MTDDASPENLRKFLESDDPAMVRMGLSMAKGSGVPEELLPTILGLYMWDDDKSVRTAARTMFFKHAPAEIQAKVKENWKPSYRTLLITGDRFPEAVCPFVQAFKSQDEFVEIALEPLIKALEEGKSFAARALGKIGDGQAVEPLIKALSDEEGYFRNCVARALGKIGDARAVEPLIEALEDDHGDGSYGAAWALGKIGGARAVEALIEALGGEHWRSLPYGQNIKTWLRAGAAKALGENGGARAVEPLIEALEDDDGDVRSSAAWALGTIGKAAVEPLIKELEYEDSSTPHPWEVRMYAARALGKIGDGRAVEPLITALGDEDEYVCDAAKEALRKLGHEVE